MFEALMPYMLWEVAGAAAGGRWLCGVYGREVPVSDARRAAVLCRGNRLEVVEGAGCDPSRAVPDGLRGVMGERAEVGRTGAGDV